MSRRVVLGSLAFLVAAAVTICIVFHPIDVTYRLWRYRSEADPYLYIPDLCEKGPSVLPHVYEAFDEHGARDDVEGFRVAVVHTLRCVRYRNVGPTYIGDHVYFDAPVDPKFVDVIVRAYHQEPSAERRHDMHVFMSELDFRAWFAIYAGFARGPHAIPYPYEGLPSVDPYGLERNDPAMRAEWCRLIAPIARDLIDRRVYETEHGTNRAHDAIRELAHAQCAAEDTARLVKILDDGAAAIDSFDSQVIWGLVHAVGSSPEKARALLLPLLAPPHSCRFHSNVAAELGYKLPAPIAEVVADALPACVREWMCRDVAASECRAQLVTTLTEQKQ
jgi:hypothetical protein